MVAKHLTGHQYYNSPIECDDNCGTCDGAKCDTCKEQYEVWGINERFRTKDEAEAAEKKQEEENNSLFCMDLIPEFYNKTDIPEYTVVDGVLCVQLWKIPSFKGDPDWGNKYLPCNQESPIYAKEFEAAQKRMNKYHECTCTNKDKDDDCNKMGCRDSSCYCGMKSGRRTEKKWYM